MPETPSSQPAVEAPLPDHLKLTREGGDLVLDVRWLRPYHVLMLFFTLFWCGFLVFWYRTALSSPHPDSGLLAFPLLHVGAGICMIYGTLAGFLNHTWVRVGSGAVDVKLGPVPWWGDIRIPATEITQVFCEEVRSYSRSGSQTTYHVNVITPGNQTRRLVPGLARADLAVYIEQEIEKVLGITDRKVPGELQK